MLTEINAANRQNIADLINGPIVCLHLIFVQGGIEEHLEKSKQEIIANIITLLTSVNFVNHFISIHNAELFMERSALSANLNSNAQHDLNDLVAAIENCEMHFMQQLAELVEEQDEVTQKSYDAMLEFLVRSNSRHESHDNTYCDHTYSHHHHHRGCCGRCFKPFEYIEHGIKGACKLLWGFAASIQHRWETSHFDRFRSHRGAKDKDATQHVQEIQESEPIYNNLNSNSNANSNNNVNSLTLT